MDIFSLVIGDVRQLQAKELTKCKMLKMFLNRSKNSCTHNFKHLKSLEFVFSLFLLSTTGIIANASNTLFLIIVTGNNTFHLSTIVLDGLTVL